MNDFAIKLGCYAFLLGLLFLSNQIVQSQLFAQQHAVGFWQLQLAQKEQPTLPEDVRTLWQLQPTLPIQQRVDAIAQHRAQSCPVKSLPQEVFARPSLAPGHVRSRHEVASQ